MKTAYQLTVAVFLLSIQVSFAQWQINGNNLYALQPTIGAGTATPNASFHVKLDYGGWQAVPNGPQNVFKVNFTDQAYANFELFNILNNGFAGIGTDAPATALHIVHSSDDNGITIDRTSQASANSIISFANNGTSQWSLGMDWSKTQVSDFFITHAGAGVPDIYVSSLGQVGIGTTSFATPNTKLEVYQADVRIVSGSLYLSTGVGTINYKVGSDGFIRARQLDVDLGSIPDYVFDESYKMMSLGELETYLKVNKHLPGIKSEKEYQTAGSINVSELNLQLLEKVEELTLYILQLNARIAELEKANGK